PSPSPPTLRRHPVLWFTDGSVILRARPVLFRVHISQLARRSAVFRDMFAIAQPPPGAASRDGEGGRGGEGEEDGEGEVMDGCPVVEMYDDAEDLANTLMAMYDGPTFGDNGPSDFHLVSGVLRIATKYVLDSLRARALAHLADAWPPTLAGWDAREERARAPNAPQYPSPIAVINLARECDAPALLPAAFYDLSRHTYAEIFECADCAPSSSSSSSIASPPHICPRTHPAAGLSPSDTHKLALGKEAAALSIHTIIAGISRGPPPSSSTHARPPSLSSPSSRRTRAPSPCTTPGTCRRDFADLGALATQHYVYERARGAADPLYVAEELGG
ncbi:hypothetical protein K488DRAFT_32377, partial [Vararia minispora EC-137]